MTIESNTITAGQAATAISHAASGITGVGGPTKDGTSSYNGNNDAKSHIGYEADYSSQAAAKLNEFVSLVHSMAAEFEAVDAEISQSLSMPLFSSSSDPFSVNGRSPLLTD